MDMTTDSIIPQRSHSVAENIPADRLNDVFYEFRTVAFNALPLLRCANSLVSDGLAAELILADTGLDVGKPPAARQRDEQHSALIFKLNAIDCFRENADGKEVCVMRYFNFDFLNEPKNVINFTNLAISAGWLPHYYNTLYWALVNEKPNKAIDLFNSIVNCINNGNPGENWRSLDEFIKGAFNGEVNTHFQTRFLAFLRSYVIPVNSDKRFLSNRTGNRERVLQYIGSCDNLTLKQISLNTGLSQATTARIVNDLVKDGRVMITHNGRAQTYSLAVINANA